MIEPVFTAKTSDLAPGQGKMIVTRSCATTAPLQSSGDERDRSAKGALYDR